MQPNDLVQRLKDDRISALSIGHITFQVRRPTDIDVANIYKDGLTTFDIARTAVTGWAGVKESDIIQGGAERQIPWNAELYAEWIKDNPQYWQPIRDHAMTAYERHASVRDEAKKNSETG